MLGFAGWYDNQPYRNILLYAPTNFSWAMGPVVLVYVQSLLNPSFQFKGKQYWHFAPALLYLLLQLFVFLSDNFFSTNQSIIGGADPDFSDYTQVPGFISMVIYFVLALRYYRRYRRLMQQLVSYADVLLFRWVRNFLLAFLSFLIITLLFEIIATFFNVYYTGSWWYYLSFALIFYYIAITGYSNAVETTIAFETNLLTNKPVMLLPATATFGSPTTATSTDVVEDIAYIEILPEPGNTLDNGFPLEEWKAKVLQLVEGQKAYEDPELSLLIMARQLQTNPSLLSKIINQGFGKNFNDFVNYFRVEAVKLKIATGEHKLQTLLSLAYECGFNSKATFNRAFQKHTGKSPSEYVKSL
jgi:AraC-like DNA-binding protein